MSDRTGHKHHQMPAGRMSLRARAGFGVVGSVSWVTGAVATFLPSGGGSGSGALVLAGFAACAMAVLGRWPTRFRVQGGELVWDDVDRAVDSQIREADRSGDPEVVAELRTLRERLETLRDTGVVPVHPAEQYDRDVAEALRRVAPETHVLRETKREHTRPDLVLLGAGRELMVETKWRPDPTGMFRGSTMPRLLSALPPEARVLVVTNAADISVGRDRVGPAHRVVSWRSPVDDAALAEALDDLTRDSAAAEVDLSSDRVGQDVSSD